METDVNVLSLMLVFLGLGSSLIHYSKYAAQKARESVRGDSEIWSIAKLNLIDLYWLKPT